ncbi:hypothetical protein BDU57DRAFT_528717 [Ampelomyces quisqualis]|uniref:Uncharacterized protein n=1 Tax=Ampelomyces quisqualis TaxID=50730 RepID=A0A6A5QU11_AMPQU|nr:hypothetical protein BDU57DRAFT_528717 [Ampelomyces quisqualis]
MPQTKSTFKPDSVSGLYPPQFGEECQQPAQAQMLPSNRHPVPTMKSSAKRTGVDVPLKSPGISFECADQLAKPDIEEELRIVRRAAAVAAADQVLNDHVSDRETFASGLFQDAAVVRREASSSLQDRLKVEQQNSNKCSTVESIDSEAKVQTEKNDMAQPCGSIQAPQSDTDLTAWAHQQWTTYFGHAPDPWWYDRAWQNWR